MWFLQLNSAKKSPCSVPLALWLGTALTFHTSFSCKHVQAFILSCLCSVLSFLWFINPFFSLVWISYKTLPHARRRWLVIHWCCAFKVVGVSLFVTTNRWHSLSITLIPFFYLINHSAFWYLSSVPCLICCSVFCFFPSLPLCILVNLMFSKTIFHSYALKKLVSFTAAIYKSV